MTALQRIEHVHVIELRLVIPGLLGQPMKAPERLKVYEEPESEKDQEQPAEVEHAEPVAKLVHESRSLVDLYKDLLSERDKERRVSVKTIRDNHSVLNRFERWALDTGKVNGLQPIELLTVPGIMRDFAGHIRSQPKGNSSAMASKALGVLIKLGNACDAVGMIRGKIDRVPKSVVNLMRPRTEKQRRTKGVPVTIDELKAMLSVLDGCKWPKLGKVKPSVFWETSLLSHYLYGFRSQDWFACRGNEKKGLLWSGVKFETECPWIEGLHNPAGWIWYLVHKTEKKDEAAERPSDVLVPMSWKIRGLIEQFKGLDQERVFPTANNSRTYSEEFSRILKRAGLSDEARAETGKPIIRLSLGQRNVASFRKGCAAWWSEKVGRPAASYLLHHSVAEEGVSKTTQDNYLQNETILRKIVEAVESFQV